MKSLLLVLVILGSYNGASTTSVAPRSGKTYSYDYEAVAMLGIPGTSDNHALHKMTMTVMVHFESDTRASLHVTDCTASSSLGKYREQEYTNFHQFHGNELQDCEELKKHCLPFDTSDGIIGTIYPSMEEPIHLLNIKRAVLSSMQGSPQYSDGKRTEYEIDVLGECKVEVRETSYEHEVILMKSRETESCPNRAVEFSTVLPESKHQEAKFVFGSTTAEMKFSKQNEGLVLEMSTVEEQQSFAPVSKGTGAVVAYFRQMLIRSVEKQSEVSGCSVQTQQSTNLMYEFPPSAQPVDSVCNAGEVINSMVNKESDEIAELFAKAIEEMRRCNKMSLTKLSNIYIQCISPDDDALRQKHTYFLDALSAVGTDPAIDLIKDLTSHSESCLNASRKLHLVASLSLIPMHYSSPCKLMRTSHEIAKDNFDSMTHTLVVGSVMWQVLQHPKHDDCTSEINEAIKLLTSKCMSSSKKQAIHAVRAMGNSGSLKSMPCVEHALSRTKQTSDDEMDLELRLAAVFSLQRLAKSVPSKVRSMVLPLYQNLSEEIEVRIAAFTVYMACYESTVMPTRELYDVVKSVVKEPSRYVQSFTYTYLSEIESSDDPQMTEWRNTISYMMKANNIHYLCATCDYDYFSSRATLGYVSLADYLPRSVPRDVMGVGISSGFVFTEASNLPRSGTIRLYMNAFGYDIEALEIGGRARGTGRLIRRLFGPTGYLRLGTRDFYPSGMPETENMCYPEEEPMWFSCYMKMFGHELAWNRADEEGVDKSLYMSQSVNDFRKIISDSVMSRFDFSEFTKAMDGIRNYFDFLFTDKLHIAHSKVNFIKSASWLDLKRSSPTIIGMPLHLTTVATLHTHLSADGDISVHSSPAAVELEGHIEPEAATYINAILRLDCGYHCPEVLHIGTAMTKFRQKATATIQEDFHVQMDVLEMPNTPESVIWKAKYNQFVVMDEDRMELGIPKRNETELYERVGGDLTNIEIITPISYPNCTGVPAAPFFPLSGPAEAQLILRPLSGSQDKFHIEFWNKTSISTDKGSFFATFAKQLETTIDATCDWYTVGEKPTQRRVVDLTATSVPVVAKALFQGNTSRRMDIEGWMSLNTSISKTWSYVKFDRSHFHGTVTRKRIAPYNESVVIKIPEFMCEVNGLLENNEKGDMSATLYLEGSDKPQWLHADFTTVGLMGNITGESSMFTRTNMGYILPYPLMSPTCSYFGRNVITFDGLVYPLMRPDCEYVLVCHRNETDNFAVTINKAGTVLNVYINGTEYTLSSDGLMVNNAIEKMPYKQKHTMQIRQVMVDGKTYTRLSAWAGIDIYYRSEGQVHLSVNGYYMGQTAGLCNNAHYDRSKMNELEKPCGTTQSVDEFVSSWLMSKSCSQSMSRTESVSQTVAEEECAPVFMDAFKEAHPVLNYEPYLKGCMYDVVHGHSADSSFYTYIMAAASKQVAIGFNPFCERKGHEQFKNGGKMCETWYKVTVCTRNCQETRDSNSEEIKARCVMPTEMHKLKNTSPVLVVHNKILKCMPK